MATSINVLRLRGIMGRRQWLPPEPFGPDGWRMYNRDYTRSVIVTVSDRPGWDGEYVHASIATADGETLPTYADLCQLHEAVFADHGYAYQIFAPADQHVNIHPTALHLWGRLDGKPVLPEFGQMGTI